MELISEVQSSTADAVRLGKEQIPIEIIKERFRQLTQMHVAYILDSLRTTTTQINNIKAYLLTALYNAPTTMGFSIPLRCGMIFAENRSHGETYFLI